MKALRFTKSGLNLAVVKMPRSESESLVRVVKSGICNTDLEIVSGYAGFHGTIGHEFVGMVEKSADKPGLIGKRVVAEINVGCGVCGLCLMGDSRHCAARTVLGINGRDGCHAEFLMLPSKNLLEVPENVSDEQAVFVEPLAAAHGITEQVEITPEMRVAVIGDGKLGILCAMSLGLKSNNVSLIGKHKSKLAIAERRNIKGILIGDTAGLGCTFDVVVEASGSESGFAAALDLVKPRGKIVLKSTFHGTPTWNATRIVVDEITIVGSRCGRFEPALGLLANRRICVDDLVSEQFDLDDGVKAFERAAQKGMMKVLLKMAN